MEKRMLFFAMPLLVLLSACGSSATGPDVTTTANTTTAAAANATATASQSATATTATTAAATTVSAAAGGSCAETAALFVTRGSANADLAAPVVSATCEDDNVVVNSNGIPDYTYVQTSPGIPNAGDLTFTIPAEATKAATMTEIPRLGVVAVALNGVPIYGPTEGTGGDVLSLVGALSECGSHNGPTGFHIHLMGTSETTDCIFTPAEVASGPQLLGYALDGYPIYTGNAQYTSSWQLTQASLFASDTWSAHSYVEGSGDLDQCNGRTDADGNYSYYTTASFPYIIGCYAGVVDVVAAGGGGGGGNGGPPQGR